MGKWKVKSKKRVECIMKGKETEWKGEEAMTF